MTNDTTTLYDEMAGSPQGSAELAAARAASRVARLMGAAHRRSGITQSAVADALRVTKGRVSQLLNSDGNVKVSSVAKFLDAVGYELVLDARPKSDAVPELTRRAPKRQSAERPSADHVWMWQQHFASGEGITCVTMLLHEIDGEHTALDRPVLVSPDPVLRATVNSSTRARAWNISRRESVSSDLQLSKS